MDYNPKAGANCYIDKAWQIHQSLKTGSTQRTGYLMAVLQRMVKPMVVTKQQMNTYLQATSTQQTDHNLMVVLQQTVILRVVASW